MNPYDRFITLREAESRSWNAAIDSENPDILPGRCECLLGNG